MKHVLLYWSHICVLHRQEKMFLAKLTEKLRARDIELEVRYFGLGYPQHMFEYLAQPNAELPDIIVSADLEVFEDSRIYNKIRHNLYNVEEWVPLRNIPSLEQVCRAPELLPVASIPLTYFTHTPESCRTKRLTEQTGLAFGGINNSAVKTVVKYIWEAYGKQAAENILSSSLVTDMPIGAYQAVRQQQANTALCPSLYGLRADEKETFLYTPQEGAVLIPSYFCARKSLPEDVARYIVNEILCQELCDFYVANGDLILYPACTTLHSKQETGLFACPSAKWLEALDPEEFLAMYTKHLPSAVNVF